jgi:hypothetical protein
MASTRSPSPTERARTAATIDRLAHPPPRPSLARVPPPDTRPEYPLAGQGQMELWLRSYAPFKTFGGGYGGDNRQESTEPRDTARVVYVLTFDYAKMTAVDSRAYCHRSHAEGLFPRMMAYTAPRARIAHDGVLEGQGIANQRTTVVPLGRPGQGFALVVEVAAGNPLVGMAADIDLQLSLRILKDGDQSLRVSGYVMGDAFPNCEVFLRDAAGDTLLLHYFRTKGNETGPYEYLPGQNFRPMGGFGRSIRMNPIGLIDS